MNSSALPYKTLASKLKAAPKQTEPELYQLVANLPFEFRPAMAYLFLGFITFMILDEVEQKLILVGYSDTEHYQMAVAGYSFDPADFSVPIDDPHNDFAVAVRTGQPIFPSDWSSVQRSEASTEITKMNQASSGITHFSIYPLRGDRRGTLMYNFYDFDHDDELKAAQLDFMEQYTELVSSWMENKLES